ncbi:DUF397 domain-containing protein [Streptomyces sp. NPDC002536]
MGDQDSRPRWRRSSYSGTNRDCVEVAFTDRAAQVRDSNSPDRPAISCSARAWAEFIAELCG